jgi:type VI secretion system (T6SS) baseplate-like injector VgrG
MAVCGKHRGVVTNNVDPQNIGRVQVQVPSVPEASGFALPCVPYAGNGVGFLAIPPIGANVWVEFEEGDAARPIWSGGFWGGGETPPNGASPDVKVIQSRGVRLAFNDQAPGGMTIEVSPPASSVQMTIKISGTTIELQNGAQSIVLTPGSVSVNNGALVVV